MIRKVVSLAFVALVLAACSSSSSSGSTSDAGASPHPTASVAVHDVMTAFCTKIHGCFPTDFAKEFASVDDCVTVAVKKVTDPNAQDACSQNELDACVGAVNAAACAATADDQVRSLPDSCSGC